jgi:hypothetical protein
MLQKRKVLAMHSRNPAKIYPIETRAVKKSSAAWVMGEKSGEK